MTPSLSRAQRFWILTAVFLGWMFAGMEMSLMIPATRPAIQAFAYSQGGSEPEIATNFVRMEVMADQWLSRFIAAFLLGAQSFLGIPATLLLGWLADRMNKAKLMAACMLFAILSMMVLIFAQEHWQIWFFLPLFTVVEATFPGGNI